MTQEEIDRIKDIAFDKAVERFPYSDEGDLEDDIDAAKRFIYQMAFIKGYEYALASLPPPTGLVEINNSIALLKWIGEAFDNVGHNWYWKQDEDGENPLDESELLQNFEEYKKIQRQLFSEPLPDLPTEKGEAG